MAASSVARLKPSPFLLPIFCRRPFVSSSRRLIPPKVKEDEYVNPVNKLFPVLRPSFWMSLVPPPLRFWEKRTTPKKKGWNPATFYIWIFMIIGSNAINTIKMKSEYLLASRKTDIKIAQLKDVLDRVQRGEDVDVAKELGTGDEQREREWKDVLRNIEEEDRIWHDKAKKKAEKKQATGETQPESAQSESEFEQRFAAVTQGFQDDDDVEEDEDASRKARKRPRAFY